MKTAKKSKTAAKANHFEKHKEKYMYAGVLTTALAHTLNGVTFKAFLFMIMSLVGGIFH